MDGTRVRHESTSKHKNRDKTNEKYPIDQAKHAFTVTSAEGPSTQSRLMLKSDIRPKTKPIPHDNPSTRKPLLLPTTSSTQPQKTTKTSPQNYSSRNSLRSSALQQKESDQNSGASRMFDRERRYLDVQEHMMRYGIPSAEAFVPLTSDSVLRIKHGFYYCLLCGRRDRIIDEQTIPKHIQSEFHADRELKLRCSLLKKTPSDDSLQIQSLGQLLSNWYESYSLKPSDISQRWQVIEEFNSLVRELNPECTCRVFGSFITHTSVHYSDINIELVHPNSKLFESDPRSKNSIHHRLVDPDADYGSQINHHTLHYDLAPNAIDTLYKTYEAILSGFVSSKSFTVISRLSDLTAKVPKLMLYHQSSNQTLTINCYTESTHKLTELLNIYINLDERVRILSIFIRHWIKQCKICNPESGTYPPDAYIIMLIYFLQRVDPPVLPCLHEMSSARTSKIDASNNCDESILKRLERMKLNGSSRNDLIDFNNRPIDNVVENNENRATDIAEGEEIEGEGEEEADEDSGYQDLDLDTARNTEWLSENKLPTHRLFVEFLKFMMNELDNSATVISIRTLKPVSIQSRKWVTTVKAVENPIRPNITLSRSIGIKQAFDYIRRCFSFAYYYLTCVPLDSKLKQHSELQHDPRDYIELFVDEQRLDFYFSMKENSFNTKHKTEFLDEILQQNPFARDVDVIKKLIESFLDNNRDPSLLPITLANCYQPNFLLPADHCHATTFCWLCRRTRHTRETCPDGVIQDLVLYVPNYDHLLDYERNMDEYLLQLYQQDTIKPQRFRQHKEVVESLTQIIQEGTGLDCNLELYGSTVNLLGCNDSDLDICMTLNGNQTGKGVDCVSILQKVNDVLMDRNDIQVVETILSARVPILKLRYKIFEIDLSMYNQCAIHNSRLLKAYVLMDIRCAHLFYLVKRFAKACGIADASRGCLSSYAWSLLVIHFLQQIRPPILPVLQESKFTQMIGVNGWNVWFREDLDEVKASMEPNNLNLTQLFKQFFIYYANFDFTKYVVSIRTSRLLTKFQKSWYGCMMAIEDPFELTYNLSSRLDDQMAIYIMNSFAKAFRHILRIQEASRLNRRPLDVEQIRRIFNGIDISGGAAPPYRGCRWCHRIGHKHKDCPDRKSSEREPRRAGRRVRNQIRQNFRHNNG